MVLLLEYNIFVLFPPLNYINDLMSHNKFKTDTDYVPLIQSSVAYSGWVRLYKIGS